MRTVAGAAFGPAPQPAGTTPGRFKVHIPHHFADMEIEGKIVLPLPGILIY